MIAVEKLKERGLGTRGAFVAKQPHSVFYVFKIFKVIKKILNPKAGAFSDGGRLRDLKMSVSKRGKVTVSACKITEVLYCRKQFFADYFKTLLIYDYIRIVGNIARCGTQMDYGFCIGANQTIGINVSHYIVANLFFFCTYGVIIDVVSVCAELFDLFGSDVEAAFHFGFRKGDPKAAPC